MSMLDIDAPAPAVAELERQTQINEDVIRYMTVRVDAHEQGPSAMMRRNERSDRDRGDRGDRGGRGRDRDDRRSRPAPRPRRLRSAKEQQHGTPIFPPPQELPLLGQGCAQDRL